MGPFIRDAFVSFWVIFRARGTVGRGLGLFISLPVYNKKIRREEIHRKQFLREKYKTLFLQLCTKYSCSNTRRKKSKRLQLFCFLYILKIK